MRLSEEHEKTLSALRAEIKDHIGGKRLTHTLSVEKEAAKLGEIFCFDENGIFELSVCGLLHDITKEKTPEEQISLCRKYGTDVTGDDIKSPKVFHEMTGAEMAKEIHPELVSEAVYDGIRYHTTGKENMTVFGKIIYLADYIEETRTFEDCVKLRKEFYSEKTPDLKHLDKIMLLSFDMTISDLIKDGKHIHSETVKARNYLLGSLSLD